MEIKEGEYVKTEEGYILKNMPWEHRYIIEDLIKGDSRYDFEFGRIVKHSSNIIDLIEERRYNSN